MSLDSIELDLLLTAIHRQYGYDYRNYARAHLKRRIQRRLGLSSFDSLSQLQHRVLHDQEFFYEVLLEDLSVNVTEMFRDPSFYLAFRNEVAPILRTYPTIKVWHAGCSTGEEVYSMAILMKEEGLLNRSIIYATDLNERVLRKAQDGIFAMDGMKDNTLNYQRAGGKESFSDYYRAAYESVVMDSVLKKNIVFSTHNLATDSTFGEMNVVVCRNVIIYFNAELQGRAIRLFSDSLCTFGFLCLGSKESIQFNSSGTDFENVVEDERIFRKRT